MFSKHLRTLKSNFKKLLYICIFQYASTTDTEVCVRTSNNDANNKETIKVDYLVIGGKFVKA